MNLKKLLLLVAFTPFNCIGGELVKDATVLEVASNATSSGAANFAIRIAGGTGVCANNSWLYFPEPNFPTINSYNQTFSIALAALASDKKVRIHNYVNDSCNHANFISVSK